MISAPQHPLMPILSLLGAAIFAALSLGNPYKIEVPISVFGLLVSLFTALLYYERLQFSKLVLERDRKIAQPVEDN